MPYEQTFITVKYIPNPDCTVATLGDETVILDAKKGIYYSLNEVGGFVWNQMAAAPRSFEELEASVLDAYNTDPVTCRTDLQEILDQLLQENLAVLK